MNTNFRCIPILLTLSAACHAQDAAPPVLPGQVTSAHPKLVADGFTGQTGPNVPAFLVRPGYRVSLAAEKLGESRFLQVGDNGALYLSQPNTKTILALRDKDGDGVYETRTPFVTNYLSAHGMDFHAGWLWFAQTGAVHKARDTNDDGVADETVTVLAEGTIPQKGGHWWRPIVVTNDGFYTGIGGSGNSNDESNTERQKIWFYSLDGKTKKLWSSGIRNTEKLRLRPGTSEVWGSDHGSDGWGKDWGESKEKGIPLSDANPPEEFNRYTEGSFYGHPFLEGNRVPRPEYLSRPDIIELAARTVVPAWSFGAHWAGNGFTFLEKDYFPGHKGDVFEAFHGSSNSSTKVGYRIERLMFDTVTGLPYGSQMIVSTLDKNGAQLDRPVDCAEAPDGTVLFTCDSGRIFRISKAE